MLTLSSPKSNASEQLRHASTLRSAAGLTSQPLRRNSERQTQFQGRASARNTRISRLLVLQGRNVALTGSAGGSPQTILQIHNGGAWEFFNNGQFRFTPTGLGTLVSTGLYPVVGNYSATNAGIQFAGSRSLTIGSTSRTTVTLRGNIFVQNGGIRASVLHQTTSSSAAVINNTPFSGGSNRTVTMSMNMVRIG